MRSWELSRKASAPSVSEPHSSIKRKRQAIVMGNSSAGNRHWSAKLTYSLRKFAACWGLRFGMLWNDCQSLSSPQTVALDILHSSSCEHQQHCQGDLQSLKCDYMASEAIVKGMGAWVVLFSVLLLRGEMEPAGQQLFTHLMLATRFLFLHPWDTLSEDQGLLFY